ncbi:MAG TPA: DinB family protein [Methylomirabilota bacterium]|nr:DinB family protein [Methylomirabilota bacterium]
MDRSLVVPSLAATPGLLRSVTGDVPAEELWTPPRAGEWSIGDVVRHLVEGERDTFLPRLKRMLAEARPVFDRKGGGDAGSRDLGGLLDGFEDARAEAVRILGSLDAAGWGRQGVSPSRGVVSVADYAHAMAEHDVEHLRQIHDVRAGLGLKPKRAEAKLALPTAKIIESIEPTPSRVLELVRGLTVAHLRHRPREGEWSMKEVMAHLLKVERDLFLPRLKRIALEDRPMFEPFDPDAWARERDHREGDFEADWQGFVEARAQTVALLSALPSEAAERIGLSGFFGPITLGQYATHVVDHDIEHLEQLAQCRAAAVRAA